MLKHELAPVVLFVYNRPQHTKQTLTSLTENKLASETVLYVFADGAKPDAGAIDIERLNETREIVKNTSGFKNITIIEKEKNEGLANSIIAGVTEIVNKHGKIIVMEDDLVVSPFFLEFMNEGLTLYQSSPNIYSINGFMYPLNYPTREAVLIPFTSTWGWATWDSKWKAFSTQMKDKSFLMENPFLASRFNLGYYQYTDMLNYNTNSWGIKWYYSVFIRGGLNVFPTRSLVKNIGFDGTGTNGGVESDLEQSFETEKIAMTYTEMIDLAFFDKFLNHFKQENLSLSRRIIRYLKRIFYN